MTRTWKLRLLEWGTAAALLVGLTVGLVVAVKHVRDAAGRMSDT